MSLTDKAQRLNDLDKDENNSRDKADWQRRSGYRYGYTVLAWCDGDEYRCDCDFEEDARHAFDRFSTSGLDRVVYAENYLAAGIRPATAIVEDTARPVRTMREAA